MKRLLIVLMLLPLFHASAYAAGLADQTLGVFDTTQMENGLSSEFLAVLSIIIWDLRQSFWDWCFFVLFLQQCVQMEKCAA